MVSPVGCARPVRVRTTPWSPGRIFVSRIPPALDDSTGVGQITGNPYARSRSPRRQTMDRERASRRWPALVRVCGATISNPCCWRSGALHRSSTTSSAHYLAASGHEAFRFMPRRIASGPSFLGPNGEPHRCLTATTRWWDNRRDVAYGHVALFGGKATIRFPRSNRCLPC